MKTYTEARICLFPKYQLLYWGAPHTSQITVSFALATSGLNSHLRHYSLCNLNLVLGLALVSNISITIISLGRLQDCMLWGIPGL